MLRRIYHIVLDAFWTFSADDGWAIASHIALSALMSLFPFLIFVTALAGFLDLYAEHILPRLRAHRRAA